MRIKPDDYYFAALERIAAASRLYDSGRHVEAIYLGGLAVECILRAFGMREKKSFDARHDLNILQLVGIAKFMDAEDKAEFALHFGNVWTRWKNDYRYATRARLRAEFLGHGLALDSKGRRIKGDFLKENARIVCDSGLRIIAIGARKWQSKQS